MSWNYRIVKRKYDNGEKTFAIHEVYYDKKGKIKMWSADPIYVYGGSFKELEKDLDAYIKAFDRPILSYRKLQKKFNIKG